MFFNKKPDVKNFIKHGKFTDDLFEGAGKKTANFEHKRGFFKRIVSEAKSYVIRLEKKDLIEKYNTDVRQFYNKYYTEKQAGDLLGIKSDSVRRLAELKLFSDLEKLYENLTFELKNVKNEKDKESIMQKFEKYGLKRELYFYLKSKENKNLFKELIKLREERIKETKLELAKLNNSQEMKDNRKRRAWNNAIIKDIKNKEAELAEKKELILKLDKNSNEYKVHKKDIKRIKERIKFLKSIDREKEFRFFKFSKEKAKERKDALSSPEALGKKKLIKEKFQESIKKTRGDIGRNIFNLFTNFSEAFKKKDANNTYKGSLLQYTLRDLGYLAGNTILSVGILGKYLIKRLTTK